MFEKFINRLKNKKQELNEISKSHSSKEEKVQFTITITNASNMYIMVISDYILIGDYDRRIDKIDSNGVANMISNSILWNNRKQKVNKGTYYVLSLDNRIYNVYINDYEIAVDERNKIDEITEERVITYNQNTMNYNYFSAKHDKYGSTFYTKYYSKPQLDLGKLIFSKEEAHEEINNLIERLSNIEEITKLIDIDILKKHILNDIGNESYQKKKQ